MRIYLDNCCFNRPFDDQSSLKIRLETEAKLAIQQNIRNGLFELGWSYILDFENANNPFWERQIETNRWKKLAGNYIDESPTILAAMNNFIAMGIKPVDSIHLACAIELQCQCFLTVDKGILSKAKNISEIIIKNPIDFILGWEEANES